MIRATRAHHKTVQLPRRDRRGTVLVVTLVILTVVTALMLTAMQMSISARRVAVQQLPLEQTRWVLIAASEPERIGQHWRTGVDSPPLTIDLQDDWVAKVTYRAADPGEKSEMGRQIEVKVELSRNNGPMVCSRSRVVAIPETN